MSKQNVPDLKELFKQASEIAQQVPENMQEAAFNRAVDLLTGEITPSFKNKIDTPKGKKKATKKTKTNNNDDSETDLISDIDSTQHPGIRTASKALDQSLMVLQIALSDHGVDGLTPSQIAKILTEKFRVSATNDAVSKALGRATSLVNRVSVGQGYLYKIMGPGEDYLAHLSDDNHETPTSTKSSIKKKTKKKSNKKKSKKKKVASKKKTSASKGKAGPKAAISTLIDSGFFSKGRTGPEVQIYLKNKRALNYDTDQLRVAMLRLVRDEKLERDENAEGQYEYKQNKP